MMSKVQGCYFHRFLHSDLRFMLLSIFADAE
jgi:hypothetical protein